MPPMPARDSTLPWLMNGKVVAGGRLPPTPDHHRPGYQSPDRALVGDERAHCIGGSAKAHGQVISREREGESERERERETQTDFQARSAFGAVRLSARGCMQHAYL